MTYTKELNNYSLKEQAIWIQSKLYSSYAASTQFVCIDVCDSIACSFVD